MLDAVEFAELRRLVVECMQSTKRFRQTNDATLQEAGLAGLFRPVVDRHESITGVRIENHNAIMHHDRSQYGAPCLRCGRVLRTPQAFKCFECGELRDLSGALA
jgi:hypothetical protein